MTQEQEGCRNGSGSQVQVVRLSGCRIARRSGTGPGGRACRRGRLRRRARWKAAEAAAMEQGTEIGGVQCLPSRWSSVEPTLQRPGRRGVLEKRGLRREEHFTLAPQLLRPAVQAMEGRSRGGSMPAEERRWDALIGLRLDSFIQSISKMALPHGRLAGRAGRVSGLSWGRVQSQVRATVFFITGETGRQSEGGLRTKRRRRLRRMTLSRTGGIRAT